MTEIIEQVMGAGKVGSILVHMGRTNNAEREGTTTVAKTYRNLLNGGRKRELVR